MKKEWRNKEGNEKIWRRNGGIRKEKKSYEAGLKESGRKKYMKDEGIRKEKKRYEEGMKE